MLALNTDESSRSLCLQQLLFFLFHQPHNLHNKSELSGGWAGFDSVVELR